MKKELYWRISPYNNGLVVAPPEIAKRVHQIHEAISNAETWRQFNDLMPKDEYAKIDRRLDQRPQPTSPFSADMIPGWEEGDYPEWLQQSLDCYLPAAILENFGKLCSSVSNGSYWYIDEANVDAVCSALRDAGWTLVHMPDLRFH
jgi:hypothetical protein